MPVGSSTSQATGSDINPRVRKALFTRPTVALKNQANWKPISTGANIMGIISNTRTGPMAKVIRASIMASPKPMNTAALTVTSMNRTVFQSARQNTSSRARRA